MFRFKSCSGPLEPFGSCDFPIVKGGCDGTEGDLPNAEQSRGSPKFLETGKLFCARNNSPQTQSLFSFPQLRMFIFPTPDRKFWQPIPFLVCSQCSRLSPWGATHLRGNSFPRVPEGGVDKSTLFKGPRRGGSIRAPGKMSGHGPPPPRQEVLPAL